MNCSRCGKKREVLFSRLGGLVTVERGKLAGKDLRNYIEVKPVQFVCLPCIKARTPGNWMRGEIVLNPTIKPSGDPLEWVISDE